MTAHHPDPRGPRPDATDEPAASSVRFAGAARVLADAGRRRGLAVPGFRSPPRVTGADRTLRRRPDGSAVVAVRVRGRPWPAVLGDMIEGVVAANGLHAPQADAVRTALWGAVERDAERSTGGGSTPARRRRPPRREAAERRAERDRAGLVAVRPPSLGRPAEAA
ncbi:MAG: hypothetical protein U0Q07_20350 [Acidimicrobiales bacterium]